MHLGLLGQLWATGAQHVEMVVYELIVETKACQYLVFLGVGQYTVRLELKCVRVNLKVRSSRAVEALRHYELHCTVFLTCLLDRLHKQDWVAHGGWVIVKNRDFLCSLVGKVRGEFFI